MQENERIATGFDFEPLANGDVLIEFFGDDGVTFNRQIMTRGCLDNMPVCIHATILSLDKGTQAGVDFLKGVGAEVSQVALRKENRRDV